MKLKSLWPVAHPRLVSLFDFFGSYASLGFLFLDVVVSAKHGLPLGIEIELPLNAINPNPILASLQAYGDAVAINGDRLAAMSGWLPLAIREPLSPCGAVPKLPLPQLRVDVILGQLAGANATNPSHTIV